MEAAWTSKMLVSYYNIAWRYKTEDFGKEKESLHLPGIEQCAD
jgi:hypothetical protein